jgi:hypothetical protein
MRALGSGYRKERGVANLGCRINVSRAPAPTSSGTALVGNAAIERPVPPVSPADLVRKRATWRVRVVSGVRRQRARSGQGTQARRAPRKRSAT